MASESFDPFALPCAPRAGLREAFTRAYGVSERLGNATGRGGAREQMLQSLLAIVDSTEKSVRERMFMLQDKAESMVIFIEVIDEPRFAPDADASFGGDGGDGGVADGFMAALAQQGVGVSGSGKGSASVPQSPGPLLIVRYAVARKTDAHALPLLQSAFVLADGTKGTGFRPIGADRDELALLEKMLGAAAARVVPSSARKGGVSLGDGLWVLSFLGVPAPTTFESPAEALHDGCFQCSTCGAPAYTHCAGCRGAVYCTQTCQKKDWKAHKKVCPRADKKGKDAGGGGGGSGGGSGGAGKDAVGANAAAPAVASAGAAGGSVDSVLVDLRPDADRASMCITTVSISGGKNVVRGPTDGGAPINRHGSSRFLVKVQVPLGGGGGSGGGGAPDLPILLYDEQRSVQAYVPLSRVPELVASVRRFGSLGGAKAYYWAVREGDSLRVFLDVARPPAW